MNSQDLFTIIIMADFGNGPYAWLRRPGVLPPACGGNIADATTGFPKEYGISKALEEKFAKWVIDFENNYNKVSFNWKKWNEAGIVLAKELKREVGDRYLVEYHVPTEGPRHNTVKSIIAIE